MHISSERECVNQVNKSRGSIIIFLIISSVFEAVQLQTRFYFSRLKRR